MTPEQRRQFLTIGRSVWKMPSGWSLDVVALDEPWIDEALRATVTGKENLPYISLPYLVLMKLASSRTQDLADISRMMGCADEDSIKAVRRIVTQHRPQDAEDLESMIRLGKLEFESQQSNS